MANCQNTFPAADLMSDHALADNGHIDMRALNGHAAHMDGAISAIALHTSYLFYTPIQATLGLGASQQHFYDSLPILACSAHYTAISSKPI
jgi:hypothetical protein